MTYISGYRYHLIDGIEFIEQARKFGSPSFEFEFVVLSIFMAQIKRDSNRGAIAWSERASDRAAGRASGVGAAAESLFNLAPGQTRACLIIYHWR